MFVFKEINNEITVWYEKFSNLKYLFLNQLKTIDEVLECLDQIILETEQQSDPLGYFAVLYRKVTLKVKEGIKTGYFENPDRMEELDIIFASRYIDAYHAYRKEDSYSLSWQKAFKLSKGYWPVVLQHLLVGMNAHINLDLGIAAAQVSNKTNLHELKNDFNLINDILSSLVEEVQENLCTVWPPLRQILKFTGQVDNILTDFSMKIARDGAWQFAITLTNTPEDSWEECIQNRDVIIAGKAELITNQKPLLQLLLGIVRLGEIGSTTHKIQVLKQSIV